MQEHIGRHALEVMEPEEWMDSHVVRRRVIKKLIEQRLDRIIARPGSHRPFMTRIHGLWKRMLIWLVFWPTHWWLGIVSELETGHQMLTHLQKAKWVEQSRMKDGHVRVRFRITEAGLTARNQQQPANLAAAPEQTDTEPQVPRLNAKTA